MKLVAWPPTPMPRSPLKLAALKVEDSAVCDFLEYRRDKSQMGWVRVEVVVAVSFRAESDYKRVL